MKGEYKCHQKARIPYKASKVEIQIEKSCHIFSVQEISIMEIFQWCDIMSIKVYHYTPSRKPLLLLSMPGAKHQNTFAPNK